MRIKDENHIPTLIKRFKELEGKKLRVGVLADKDADLAVIAAANEFGSKSKKGNDHIPERPAFRNAFDDSKRVDEAIQFGRRFFYLEENPDKTMEAIALSMVDNVQTHIESNIQPQNAPSTIAKKGSARTLIDTGRLKQSITFEVL